MPYPFRTPHIGLLTCHSEDRGGQRPRTSIGRASRGTRFLSALRRSGPWHRLLTHLRGRLEFRRQSDPLSNPRSSRLPGRPAGWQDSLARTQAGGRDKQWSSGRHGDLLGHLTMALEGRRRGFKWVGLCGCGGGDTVISSMGPGMREGTGKTQSDIPSSLQRKCHSKSPMG